MHTNVHKYTQSHKHVHTQTHTNTHTHTHTHTQTLTVTLVNRHTNRGSGEQWGKLSIMRTVIFFMQSGIRNSSRQ